MNELTFGAALPEDQPTLFSDSEWMAKAMRHPDAKRRKDYQGGQLAMCCARCWDTAGPFIRTNNGYAYCAPCAALVLKEG